MSVQILGVSGSPVKNSNTDRVIQAILDASGLVSESIKLSTLNVGPCRACKACIDDNVCQVNDDFPALAEKVKAVPALVIGGYTPYGMLDAFTKAFLERLWSMRHVNNLNRGKLVVTVVTGLTLRSINLASEMIAVEMLMERVSVVGQLKVNGSVPCLTCGNGDVCEMSGIRYLYGRDARATPEFCVRAEDQTKVWKEALRLGQDLGDRVRNENFGSGSPIKRGIPFWRIPMMMAMLKRTQRWTTLARKHRK